MSSPDEEERTMIFDLEEDITPTKWIVSNQTVEAVNHLEVLREIESSRTSTKAMRKAKKRERLNRAQGRRR